jgi:phthalate 4,5-cis-dihydrodiol dehydrogenase
VSPVQAAQARPLRLGIVGFGAAAQAFIPAIQARGDWRLVAIAEPAQAMRTAGENLADVAWFDSMDSMLAQASLDAVYIATPTPTHMPLAVHALRSGHHVLVEKPMALSVRECKKMVQAARTASRVLMVGHSHGFDAPIQAMRDIITSGQLGRVRMVHSWCYTNWMHRPRRAEELVSALGGGVTFRQGAHQFDVARYLCGGLVRSVRAQTFDWLPSRSGVGAHTVFLDFEDGAVATAIYNGYGGFSSADLVFGISEWGERATSEGPLSPLASAIGLSEQAAILAKRERAGRAIAASAAHPPFFGLTLVSCERGDMRQSPDGLWIDTPQGRTAVPVATEPTPRQLVLDNWMGQIRTGENLGCDGSWGLATLEICEAALRSAKLRREVRLKHQVPVRDGLCLSD